MTRNHLIAAHGFLERREGTRVSDLIDILYCSFIVAVIALVIAGWFG